MNDPPQLSSAIAAARLNGNSAQALSASSTAMIFNNELPQKATWQEGVYLPDGQAVAGG
jgi:hypothetical protein